MVVNPKIGILGAAFDTGNMGVSALAVGSVRVILHRYPEAEVYFLNYDRSPVTYTIQFPGRQVTVPLVNMRFSWRFWLSNNIAFLLFLTVLMKLVPFAALRRRWIAGNDCLRQLDESDLVVAISGGDSFSDIYGLGRLLYVSLPQILALWAGKRLILLPQTLGPFKSRFAWAIAKYIMKRAEAVYSRDHAGEKLGAEILGSNSSAGKVRFCYDVGFVLEPTTPERVDIVGLEWLPRPDRCPVGLNISGLLAATGLGRYNDFGLRVEYERLVHNLIEYFIEKKGTQVLLIPHVFGTRGEGDPLYCERVYQALEDKYRGRLGQIRGRYDQNEIKYIIGKCDFFVGARMHACIAAASQNVPVVPMAYSDKFVGVMQTIGIEANVVDLRKMDEEEIFDVIDRAFEHRTQVRQQLVQTMPQVKETVLRLFQDMELDGPGSRAGTTMGKVPLGA